MHCIHCGAEAKALDKFCRKCGAKSAAATPAPSVSAEPQTPPQLQAIPAARETPPSRSNAAMMGVAALLLSLIVGAGGYWYMSQRQTAIIGEGPATTTGELATTTGLDVPSQPLVLPDQRASDPAAEKQPSSTPATTDITGEWGDVEGPGTTMWITKSGSGYEASFLVSIPGCIGSIEGPATLSGNELKLIHTEFGSCTITAKFNGSSAEIDEDGCFAYHGAACEFAGSLSKALAPVDNVPQRVGSGGNIMPPQKTHDVLPIYPPIAQSERVQGIVTIDATIGPDGAVKDAKVLRSIPGLDQAALDAVRQWVFAPTLVDGVAVAVIMTVTTEFRLQ